MAQYNELVAYCADFEYVILAGDFNASAQWDYGMADVVAPLFHDAGFSSSWCDYMGAVDTYPDSEYQPANLDNVFVKGFSVTNSQVVDDSIDLSDHKMIFCELTMI
jgi:endonuclease/exonuclease/phosphatase family metal-dependent hydrolase